MNPYHDRLGRFSQHGGSRAPAHQAARNMLAGALRQARADQKVMGIPARENSNVARHEDLVMLTAKASSKTAAGDYLSGFNRGSRAFERRNAVRGEKNHGVPQASKYNAAAVNRAIASNNRHGPKIGGREAVAIHRLLRGRH